MHRKVCRRATATKNAHENGCRSYAVANMTPRKVAVGLRQENVTCRKLAAGLRLKIVGAVYIYGRYTIVLNDKLHSRIITGSGYADSIRSTLEQL